MTQKEELTQAQAKITDLEKQLKASEPLQTQLNAANTNLKAAEGARDTEKARADKAETDLSAANSRADKAGQDLSAANAKIGGLEKDQKDTTGKANEQLSALGLNRQQKADDVVTGAGDDIAAVAETFLSAKTSMSEKAALLRKHGSKLAAYAGNIPNRG